jgi:hypothetical protein
MSAELRVDLGNSTRRHSTAPVLIALQNKQSLGDRALARAGFASGVGASNSALDCACGCLALKI